jgi:hypothetical protein
MGRAGYGRIGDKDRRYSATGELGQGCGTRWSLKQTAIVIITTMTAAATRLRRTLSSSTGNRTARHFSRSVIPVGQDRCVP